MQANGSPPLLLKHQAPCSSSWALQGIYAVVWAAPWLLAVFFAVLVPLLLAGMLGVRAAALSYHDQSQEVARGEVNQAARVADAILAGWLSPTVALAAIIQQMPGVVELCSGFESSGRRIAINVSGPVLQAQG